METYMEGMEIWRVEIVVASTVAADLAAHEG